ncbi:S1 family peptidase [Acholeplasma hippikon]|uniref:Periplasmic serine endoprotease DegP n=1 Tax=Acholeplasma hippikon TaxID=264636 RepID=A0A449BLN4_9MOLU|nr:serine protease [Acholeplasma hippikon]VEU83143.1 Periplasmic serine endoprotease DegP precursor [Acholeplasma hippikon]VEU83346.1 Periplasmic serine endoprotease DegP precursor [Acholeplasma hippikon]
MLKKLILLLGAFGLLLFVCLYDFTPTQAVIPDEPINHSPIENSADSSRSVLKLVHTLQGNNQMLNKTASAVVIHEDETYYYAITNYHVLDKDNYETVALDLYDYLGNQYQASKISLNQAQQLISEIYDLGLIKFEKLASEFVIPDVRTNPLNSTVLLTAVGYPNGTRSITNGYYQNMVNIENFPFQVISHNVSITHGNSGGGLFDASGKLVGINVAAALDLNGDLVQSYAIPTSKVLEYLSLFNL